MAAELDIAAGWVREAERVVAFTGAGISTDSGIPDFRGPNGVWTKNPAAEKAATLQHYLADPEVRRAAWQNRLRSSTWSAEPNLGHRALVELERQGRLMAVVTQNGVQLLNLQSHQLTPFANPEPRLSANRLNDAKVDRAGRLWVGSMAIDGTPISVASMAAAMVPE